MGLNLASNRWWDPRDRCYRKNSLRVVNHRIKVNRIIVFFFLLSTSHAPYGLGIFFPVQKFIYSAFLDETSRTGLFFFLNILFFEHSYKRNVFTDRRIFWEIILVEGEAFGGWIFWPVDRYSDRLTDILTNLLIFLEQARYYDRQKDILTGWRIFWQTEGYSDRLKDILTDRMIFWQADGYSDWQKDILTG